MLSQSMRRTLGAALSLLLLCSLLMPVMAFGAAPVAMTDLSDSYAQKEIQSLADAGIVSGYQDGSFRPGNAMTRAELAKILVLTLGLQEKPEKSSVFTDVEPADWYNGYVGALIDSGITEGTSATEFSPNANVTREQLVVFFIRAMGLEKEAQKLPADAKLADLGTVSSWAQPHVSLAFKLGFVGGMEAQDGTFVFQPKEYAQRQALARLAYEFMTQRSVYIEKAKALASETRQEPAISSVSVINNSTVEVAFQHNIAAPAASDFTFDNGLSVTSAALKDGSASVVVLTTSVQTAGTVYKLSYQGQDTGHSITGAAAAAVGGGGGGGGGSRGGDSAAESDLTKINRGGTYSSLTIAASGTAGPADGAQKTVVTGTLTLNPGKDGEITLQNVEAEHIVVASGSSNSIKLRNTVAKTLRMAAGSQTNPVRIESLEGSSVTNTDVQSKAIIESANGSLGVIVIGSGAAGQEVELRGTIREAVTVQSAGARIKLAAPKDGGTTVIAGLIISSNAAAITTDAGTTLESVQVTAPNASISLTGEGGIGSVTVSQEAAGSALQITNSRIASLRLEANVKLDGDAAALGAVPIIASPGVVIEAAPALTDALKNNAAAAIAAIGDFTDYSQAIESQIAAAETLANNAILLGVAADDITGYAAALPKAKSRMTELALDAASRDVSIGFADHDAKEAVTRNVTLAAADTARGVAFAWNSSNPAVLTATGIVTRPAAGEKDAEVILSVTLTKNNQERHVEFRLLVLAQQSTVEPQPALVSLSAEPASIVFSASGSSRQLKISAAYSNGDVREVTKQAAFLSSDPSVAAVSLSGMVTAAANGITEIQASYEGKTVIVPVTVDMAPTTAKIMVTATAGDAQADLSWNSIGASVVYQVYSSRISGYYKDVPATVTETAYHAAGLQNDVEYYFIIKATIDGGIIASNEVKVVPAAAASEQKTAMPTVTGAVYTNGWLLQGTAEPGAPSSQTDVVLQTKEGMFLDYTRVNWDGSFILDSSTLSEPRGALTAGEELWLTAQHSGKQNSDPVKLVIRPTQGQTQIPTVIGSVYDITTSIEGYTEPGARIVLRDHDHILSSTIANKKNGYYSVSIYEHHQAGEELTLSAESIGKAASDPVRIILQAYPVTLTPTVKGNIYTNGWSLMGSMPPGSAYSSTSIILSRQDGTELTRTNVYSDGSFQMTSSYATDLIPTLTAGEQLNVTAQEYGKPASDPIELIVKPTVGQTQPPAVTGNVYENTNMVSGYAEPYVFIQLANSANEPMAGVYSSVDGYYRISVSKPFQAGEQLILTAMTIGRAVSDPVRFTVQTTPKTPKPTVTGAVYTNGWKLQGVVEASDPDSTISILLSKKDGTEIDNGYVNEDGTFSLSSNEYDHVELTAGEELLLTAKAFDADKSDPVIIIVQAINGQTAQVVADVVNDAFVSGWAPYQSIVNVTNLTHYSSVSFIPSRPDGYFSYGNSANQVEDVLSITATSIGEATSTPLKVTVSAAPVTAQPTITGGIYDNGGIDISGQAEPGMPRKWTMLTLSNANPFYRFEYNIPVQLDGSFSEQSLNGDLARLSATGTELQLQLVAQAFGKKPSEPLSIAVQPTTGVTPSPTVNSATVASLTGLAVPGAIIKATTVTGYTIPITAALDDGSFDLGVIEAGTLNAGDVITVTATKLGQATSKPVYVTVQATEKTNVPTVTGNVYPNAYALYGTVGPSLGYTTFTIARQKGSPIATFYSDRADGEYSAAQILDSYIGLSEGKQLLLRAQTYGKAKSDPVVLTVQATHGQTEVPTYNNDMFGTDYFKGTAEPGALIELTNNAMASRYRTTAAADGSFSIQLLSGEFRAGDLFSLTATVVGKETSTPVNFTMIKYP
ncbi:S-layer homology domain-containing protein [Paenibacillus doosanensis]|uniref:S-layer homology domain-containing protein n=1 Tax=Paenibacillus doosanensis TaxID=1229154 RepID=UPI0021803AEE|nr:S-layer homology domain-containing protein [Paenibacillus doosanensis]MCS7464859.1 S-layer homology domain-containing protein [Paenibacillus doosanensis]